MDEPREPAPGLPTDAAEEAARAAKKKDKARKQWYNFAGRVAAQVIGAAASVALGLYVIQRSQQREPAPLTASVPRSESPRGSQERAIAVLPLNNFAEDARNDYFADGMTEAITLELARIGGLHVISRTSAMRYKTERKSMPVIAQELDVDFVVEGSVTRADDRVRVTAQLIDARSDQHLWARSYDGSMKDVLGLQSRVAAAIAAEVKGAVAPVRTRRAVDPAVYDIYLRGRHAWSLRTPEGFTNAIKYFNDAIARDPEFALAHAGLADAFSLFPTSSLVDRSVDNFAQARAAAEKALALDPELAEAHTSLAAVYFFGERNFEAAAKEFQRALQLNDHYPTAHQWYAIALSENGRHDEARRHAEEAVNEDPLNGVMHQALGLVRYYSRDYQGAIASERRALDLNPQLPLARAVLAKALVMSNQPKEAVAVLQQSPQPNSANVGVLIALAETYSETRPPSDALVKRFEGTTPAAVLKVDPLYEKLRADPRFGASR
jgi:TolB-like protein/Tfp pilus assembly protein PilF